MAETGGSGRTNPVVITPRLTVPTTRSAPSGAWTIDRFIQSVEYFENSHPESQQRDTSYMITRLRKIFYGKDGWDSHLIPRAASVPRPYQVSEVEYDRFSLSIPGVSDTIYVVRKRYQVRSGGQEPPIYQGQELRLQSGFHCDIGHTFAGLDALNHPSAAGILNIRITRNADAVTWVGDLGSVLAEWFFKRYDSRRGRGSALTLTELQEVIDGTDGLAPPQDMLGNIDAFAIRSHFNTTGRRPGTAAPPGMSWQAPKVSEILRDYYLQSNDALLHRYSRFAQSIGLTGWNGTRFVNEASRVSYYTDEVNDAAALYLMVNTDSAWYSFPARAQLAMGMAINQGAAVLVRAFFNEIKAKIRQEP